jgi:hypothetical protein
MPIRTPYHLLATASAALLSLSAGASGTKPADRDRTSFDPWRRGIRCAVSAMLLALFTPALAAGAAESPKVRPVGEAFPKRALFVGNSYLYYGDAMPNHVRRLAAAADPKDEKRYVTATWKSAMISGSNLSHHHIQSYLGPGKLGQKEPFEVVVLQGGSGDTGSAERRALFEEKVVEFDREIRKTGAKTALYMIHAYGKAHPRYNPAMIRDIEKLYVSAGNRVGALVIPVGLAFEEAYRQRPDLALHKDYDGSHPDLLGTYLAACVTYASLYGKPVTGNPYDYYGRIDREMVAFLQGVADRTVRRFYGLP